MDAEQARHVLIGLVGALDDTVMRPADWYHVASLTATYAKRYGVNHAVINEARLMTVEHLVLTALGLNPLDKREAAE